MARTNTTEGQGLRQPGGAEKDSRFREGDRLLCLAYADDEEENTTQPNCLSTLYLVAYDFNFNSFSDCCLKISVTLYGFTY